MTPGKTLRIRTRDTLQAQALQDAAEAYGFQGERNIKPLAAVLEAIQTGNAAVIDIGILRTLYAANPSRELRQIVEVAEGLVDK